MSTANELFGDVKPTVKDDQHELTGEEALASLVGEGKKYATTEDMAKGMAYGQQHITILEQENSSLRDSAIKAKGVDDILKAMKGQQNGNLDVDQNHDDNHDDGSKPPDVQALIDATLAKRDAGVLADKEEANKKDVVRQLSEKYGPAKASEIYNKVGDDLGINLDDLAAKSPDAVMKLVADARPVHATDSGLPPSSHHAPLNMGNQGILNKEAIDKMYTAGQIKLHEKHQLENQMLTELGPDEFWKKG